MHLDQKSYNYELHFPGVLRWQSTGVFYLMKNAVTIGCSAHKLILIIKYLHLSVQSFYAFPQFLLMSCVH